jgi:hypothetical protein
LIGFSAKKQSILGYPLTTGIPKTLSGGVDRNPRGPGWFWADWSHPGMTEEFSLLNPFEWFILRLGN